MGNPSPDDVRWSRRAAGVMLVIGAIVLLAGQLVTDERFAALGFVLGVPLIAVGGITIVYTRVRPVAYRQIEPLIRRRRG